MKWCSKCVLPDSRPNIVIQDDGICNACHAHSTKTDIDWVSREASLRKLINTTKNLQKGYDCLIPVSGGKDSTWQVIKCLEYGLKPLAVTWKTPVRTEIGQQNLDNLVALGIDHIDYQINPKIEAEFMLKTYEKLGSTGIPMHLALFNIPLTLAVRFQIPLVIWGENSAFEYGTQNEALTGFKLDREWLKNYGVTHGTTAQDWVDSDLSEKELTPYFGPDPDTLEASGVRAIFLGYYLPWDPEETKNVAMAHGFKSNQDGARTGYYDYADIDDDFISLHHWLKWYKFGFTRTFDNLSLEIRNGRLDRTSALKIIADQGDETPWDDIEKFCNFANITKDKFLEMAETFRNQSIWTQKNGKWVIKDFLLEDWNWS
ncbi:N-acetyl sugar amidotransferase [Kiloniella majae]|uniref:N-acetyl sugar amidotransferase n=1 Tax=Kiloniella majae TaxID=1938558 RepID=UPI0015C50537|nr:N-acetyl sugar amidotransferase [Kiloniella majae]